MELHELLSVFAQSLSMPTEQQAETDKSPLHFSEATFTFQASTQTADMTKDEMSWELMQESTQTPVNISIQIKQYQKS